MLLASLCVLVRPGKEKPISVLYYTPCPFLQPMTFSHQMGSLPLTDLSRTRAKPL